MEFAVSEARYHALLRRLIRDDEMLRSALSHHRATVLHGDVRIHLEHLFAGAWHGYRLVIEGEGAELIAMLLSDLSSELCLPVPENAHLPSPRGELVADNQCRIDTLLARAADLGGRVLMVGSALCSVPFSCPEGTDVLARFLTPYYRLTPAPATSAPVLRIVSDGGLFSEAGDLWRSFEYQVWDNVPGHPRTVSRGDGYRFYATREGSVLGRFRYPYQRDGVPALFARGTDDCWNVLHDGSMHGHRAAGRALRAFACRDALCGGAISVHASAFTDARGGVYLICGDKGAGKTTNVIEALGAVPGARLVSNDRVFLHATDAGVVVTGSPHSIPVRIGSFLASADMRRKLDDRAGTMFGGHERGYDVGVTIQQTEYGNARGLGTTGEQIFFDPVELAAMLGTTVLSSGLLRGVIVIERGGAAHPGWEALPGACTRDILERHEHPLYESASPYWNDLLGPPAERMRPAGLALDGVKAWSIRGHMDLAATWAMCPDEIAGVTGPLDNQTLPEHAPTTVV